MKLLSFFVDRRSTIVYFMLMYWNLGPSLFAQAGSLTDTKATPTSSLDSLHNLVKTSTDTLDALQLYATAREWMSRDMKVSYQFIQASLHLSKKLSYTEGVINACRGLSAINGFWGERDSALYYVEQGLAVVHLAHSPKKEEINLLINRGAAYTQVDELTNAIAANLEAYKIVTAHNIPDKAGLILNNMGILYRKQGRYAEALNTYHKALDVKIMLDDRLGQANTCFNIGALYAKLDSLSQAITAIKKAKQFYHELGRSADERECELALGHAYFDNKQLATARALLVPLEQDSTLSLPKDKQYQLYLMLAQLALYDQKFSEAKRLLEHISEVTNSEWTEELSDYYRIKSEIAQCTGNLQDALDSYQFYITYQEEISDLENKQFRETLVQQFQAKEKDLTIQNLNQLSAAQQDALLVRNRALSWGAGALVILLLLLYSLYRLFRKNRKNQRQLAIQHTEISSALQQNKLLLQEIHHRVKNNLQVITSLLSMQERKMENEDTKAALRSSKLRIQSMSILHQILYKDDSVRSIAADEYLEQLAQQIMDTFQSNTAVELSTNITPIQLDIDTLIPVGLICNELLTNALKHAFHQQSEGKLELKLRQYDSQIVLSVADNGNSFTGNDFPQRQGSLGTRLIRAFTQRLDGKMRIDNSAGTLVEISFPFQEQVIEKELSAVA